MHANATTTNQSIRNLRRALVARGLTWNQIKSWDKDQLLQALEEHKQLLLSDPDTSAEQVLQAIRVKHQHYKLLGIAGAVDFLRRFEPGMIGKELSGPDEEIILQVLERICEKKKERLEERRERLDHKSANRGLYLPSGVMEYGPTKGKEKNRWSFGTQLQSLGLMHRVLQALGEQVEGTPCSLRLVNNLPVPAEAEELAAYNEEMSQQWAKLRAEGWLPTKENLAWNWAHPGVKRLLLAAFPDAVSAQAYNHRLGAPLYPNGFLQGVKVLFRAPQSVSRQLNEELVGEMFGQVVTKEGLTKALIRAGKKEEDAPTGASMLLNESYNHSIGWFWETCEALGIPKPIIAAWNRKLEALAWESTPCDQETDGSGLYNPTHPMWAELVAKYGPVVFQFSLLRPDGLFAKGILVPREGMDPEVSVQLHPNQVKGSWKNRISEGGWEEGCFLGIMNAWKKRGTLPCSFEQLEMLEELDPSQNQRTMAAHLGNLTKEFLDDMTSKGLDGLMAEAIKDNPTLALVAKVLYQLRGHGRDLSPMSIPMLKNAIEATMGKKLWLAAQGAGIKGRQMVAVLDAGVPRGRCVVEGYQEGQILALWRFPTLLPQGLPLVTAMAPAPHHLVEGKVVRNAIFLNPVDLTIGMQGDDDGDIVGVSEDPRVVELWRHKLNDELFQIEPKGVKFDIPLDSEEGFKYMETDPMGPIGLTCIWGAMLFAVGDWDGARAMAVLNQEAVDSAKRRIAWTDIEKASRMAFWFKDEQGIWHLKPDAKLHQSRYEEHTGMPYGFPKKALQTWMSKRLDERGCRRSLDQTPLGWRSQHKGKTIQPSRPFPPWVDSRSAQLGCQAYSWIHRVHDYTRQYWLKQASKWEKEGPNEMGLDIRDLIFELAKQKGVNLTLTANSWEEYLLLRKEAGIEWFAAAYRRMRLQREELPEAVEVEELAAELYSYLRQLSPSQLATIWYWESTPTWSLKQHRAAPVYLHEEVEGAVQVNRINYAIRALCFPGSPMLKLLGIEEEGGCGWLNQNNLGDSLAQYFLRSEKPFTAMAQRCFGNTTHGDQVKGEGGTRVEFHQCPHCMEDLQLRVIRGWRDRKTVGEMEALRSLTRSLNREEERDEWSEYYQPQY